MKVSKPILGLLVATIFFAGYLVLFTGGKKGPAPVAPPQRIGGSVRASGAPPATGQAVSPTSPLSVTWGRDPFSAPRAVEQNNATKPEKTALKLEAIVEGAKGRVAVIDKQVVVKGDSIGGEKVLDIARDRVVLIRGDAKRSLLIGEAKGDDFVREETPAKTVGEKK